MLVLTVGSFSVFGEISEITVNYQSDLAFLGFPSFLFSLYILLIYQGLSADAPPPGPHGGGGGGPHGSGGPTPPGLTAGGYNQMTLIVDITSMQFYMFNM